MLGKRLSGRERRRCAHRQRPHTHHRPRHTQPKSTQASTPNGSPTQHAPTTNHLSLLHRNSRSPRESSNSQPRAQPPLGPTCPVPRSCRLAHQRYHPTPRRCYQSAGETTPPADPTRTIPHQQALTGQPSHPLCRTQHSHQPRQNAQTGHRASVCSGPCDSTQVRRFSRPAIQPLCHLSGRTRG